jgi:hypothetical protein
MEGLRNSFGRYGAVLGEGIAVPDLPFMDLAASENPMDAPIKELAAKSRR